MSIAVWAGIIALLGIDAETGVFMLLYLDLAYDKAKREHAEFSKTHLYEAIVEGAAKRLRPKFMTFATMTIGLIPILWSTGTGSEIMKRIAHAASIVVWIELSPAPNSFSLPMKNSPSFTN